MIEALWPQPKHSLVARTLIDPSRGMHLEQNPLAGSGVLEALEEELAHFGGGLGEGYPIRFVEREMTTAPKAHRWEAYRLDLGTDGIILTAGTRVGWFYAAWTLVYWLRLHRFARRTQVSCLKVEDYPDLTHRGVMLDVSRDRVPTMPVLKQTINRLASLKINQIQFYTEHSFAYRNHRQVWQDADPLTAEEVQELDAYCRARHIELVPNQNSLGHFHRWLTHSAYRPLAEVPEGVSHPFSKQKEPFSLCPEDPAVHQLLEELYDELLPNFTSKTLNVGLDETFDIGMGRSAQSCRAFGKDRVYLNFLKSVHRMAADRGYRIQFWGDIMLHHPELMSEIPKDAIALEWGYEANHPFERNGQAFSQSGLDHYVCPGTSSWQSIVGRGQNALENLAYAARAARSGGAKGYLITDWGDWGHLQPAFVSWPGFVLGAGFSWRVPERIPAENQVIALLNHYAYNDIKGYTGRVAWDLSNLYRFEDQPTTNGTCLFMLLRFPDYSLNYTRLRGINNNSLVRMAHQLSRLRAEAIHTLHPAQIGWACDMVWWLVDLADARLQAGRERGMDAVSPSQRARLIRTLRPLIERHRELWLRDSRPGGLENSAARLEDMSRQLEKPPPLSQNEKSNQGSGLNA